MKRKLIYSVFLVISLFMIVGCSSKTLEDKEQNDNINNVTQEDNISNSSENKSDDSNEVISSVKVFINDKEYTINLEDNETTKEFINLLPLDITMNELNDNEKYIYLDNTLSTNSSNPKHIKAGDVMLYGNNCLVIFYKSFDTSYSYTKIGHIDNLPNLGNGNISIKIEE